MPIPPPELSSLVIEVAAELALEEYGERIFKKITPGKAALFVAIAPPAYLGVGAAAHALLPKKGKDTPPRKEERKEEEKPPERPPTPPAPPPPPRRGVVGGQQK